MKRRHKFRLYYSNGVSFVIKAKECEVTKTGNLITNVAFDGAKNWTAFHIDDLVAIVKL